MCVLYRMYYTTIYAKVRYIGIAKYAIIWYQYIYPSVRYISITRCAMSYLILVHSLYSYSSMYLYIYLSTSLICVYIIYQVYSSIWPYCIYCSGHTGVQLILLMGHQCQMSLYIYLDTCVYIYLISQVYAICIYPSQFTLYNIEYKYKQV